MCLLFAEGFINMVHSPKSNNVKKKKIKSYGKFEKEIKNLVDFYKMNSIYLERFDDKELWKEDLIISKAEEIDSKLEIKIPKRTRRVLEHRKGLIFVLRELIYVRLISALEVFLIDSVKDVFFITKKPFKDNSAQYQLSQSQLLSFSSISEIRNDIIKRETRKLSSKGFVDIVKYYKRRFDIDLGGFEPGKKKMIEYHEIRHILVHRLGKVDKKFIVQYGYEEGTISLTEDFLIKAIDDLLKFCNTTKKALNDYLKNHLVDHTSSAKIVDSYIQCSLKSKEVFPFFILPEFEFSYKDELKVFKDIQSSTKYSEDRLFIELWGELDLLNAYIKELRMIVFGNGNYRKMKVKRMALKSYLESLPKKKSSVQVQTKKKKNIRQEKHFLIIEEDVLISKIKDLLPEQPWEKGIHKHIAKQLNVSNSQVSRVINKLMKSGDVKRQLNGELIELKK